MLINQRMFECLCFVAEKKKDNYRLHGTCFFAIHPIEGTQLFEIYAVTASHVVRGAAANGDGFAYFRIDQNEGPPVFLKTAISEWEFHGDAAVDVAIRPMGGGDDDFRKFNRLAVPTEFFATPTKVQSLKVRPGEGIYFPGLFVRHYGLAANIPIMRTGTIAAMPIELMPTGTGHSRVYLAELRSIGGHSGSPVFLDLGSVEKAWEVKDVGLPTEQPVLLGMITGHWDLHSPAEQDFNSGIATVIPADDITHVLNQPAVIAKRTDGRAALIAAGGNKALD